MSKKISKAICTFGARFMLEQVLFLENQIDGVQKSEDSEYVHQMRVASRRLRTGLILFKDCLPGKKSKVWLDDIMNIAHALGNARDLDVQIAELSQLYNDDLDAKYKPGYARLLLRLKQSRVKSQKKINKTIFKLVENDSLSDMTSHFGRLAEECSSTYSFTSPLYLKACDDIKKELDNFLSYQIYLREQDPMDKLHAMRIAGKHLRYTMELFAPVFNGALDPFIILMKDIQNLLGEIHDNDVWVNWLPTFIEKEQARVEDYFGNTIPLIRLLPGLNHLIEDRTQAREKACQAFLLTWDSINDENAWQILNALIQPPADIDTGSHDEPPKDASESTTGSSEEAPGDDYVPPPKSSPGDH